MLEPARWSEVKEVVLGALDLPEDNRRTFIAEACGDDPALQSAAESLLVVSTEEADRFDEARLTFPSHSIKPLAEGTLIDDFRVVRALGEGAMSAVYLATDTKHDRQVALKVLSLRGLRFSRSEHRLLGRLTHTNIATLYDSGTTEDGLPYLAMEYIDGRPLAEYCEAHCPTVEATLRLFLAICDGVQYAHQHLVIHRDLKPGNILVTHDGVPKLLDFGIAKRLPLDALVTRTETHRPLTLAFASPEQLRGEATATTSDIYSLGVLLCVLLTGSLPYRVRDVLDLYSAIPSQEPEKPSILARHGNSSDERPMPLFLGPNPPQQNARRLPKLLKGDLDAIALKALRKEPEKRYQTVTELADDIQRYLRSEPVSARRGSQRYRLAKFLRRHRTSALVTALILVTLLCLSIALLIQYREATIQRDQAQQHLIRAEQTKNFLLDIFSASNPWEHPEEELTARDLLDRASDSISSELQAEPLVRADFMATLARAYYRLGLFEKAVALQRQAVRLREDELGPRHEETATALNDLGVFLNDLGHYEEAKKVLTMALSIRTQLFGADSSDVSTSYNNLGTLALRMGDFRSAEANLRRAIAIREQLDGDFRMKNATSYGNLAIVLRGSGKIDKAEIAARRALELKRQILPLSHPSVANSLDTLASVLKDQGSFEEAEALLREAVEVQKHAVGNEHPEFARTLSNLALLFLEMGQLQKAEQTLRATLSIRRRVLPREHPDIASSLHNLAGVLRENGKLEEAENSFREALAIRSKALGDSHVRVAATEAGLSAVLVDMGKLDEAELLAHDSLRIVAGQLEEDNPLRATSEGALGRCFMAQGRYELAEAHLLRSYRVLLQQKGQAARDTKRNLRYLVELYESWDRRDKAAEYRLLLAKNATEHLGK